MTTRIIPTLPEISREALVLVGGAILAAFIVGRMPKLKGWIKTQWSDNPQIAANWDQNRAQIDWPRQ